MEYTAYKKSDPNTIYEFEGTINLAAFIASRSPFDQDFMIFKEGKLFITLIGFFIDKAADKEFLGCELLPILIPMQRGLVPIPTVNVIERCR